MTEDESRRIRLLEQTVLVDPQNPLPLYAQLTRGLRELIHNHFEDGERFYGEQGLSQRLGISVNTVRRALADLAAEGLLERHVPKGTFVRKSAPGAEKDFNIGVFLSTFDSTLNMLLLEHVAKCCDERGYRFEVLHTRFGDKLLEQLNAIKKTPEHQAFLALTTHEASTWRLYRALTERGYRIAVIDRRMESFPGCYVGVDNAVGIRLGMAHLAELGHGRVTLLVCEDELHPNVQERIRAFEAFARDHGRIGPRIVVCDETIEYPEGASVEECYEMYVSEATVDEILAADPPPTAVFAVSDAGARVLLRRLAERGVRVPGDLSVVGFGNEGYACLTFPPLTTLAQPFEQIVRRAIDFLETPGRTPAQYLIAPSLVVRNSTAAPPSSFATP